MPKAGIHRKINFPRQFSVGTLQGSAGKGSCLNCRM